VRRLTTVPAPADTAVPADAGRPPRWLAGLDGIRGLAALFVVVNHVFLRAFPGYPVDRAPFWAGWFIYGRFAVVVFIVLSGFSLALSPARHGWRLDGVSRFARRRALRILPAYYAALAFSLAVAWLVVPPPGAGTPGAKSVVVNGLLLQNLIGAPTPDRSFWSIAVEAQLYVVFPLLLLMVRRWGAILMVAIVTLVVVTVGIVGPHVARLDVFVVQSAPDLAALFALGVVTAGIVGAGGARRSWPWAALALAAAAPVFALIAWQGSVWTLDHLFWVDLALGPAVACLLAGLATGHPAPLVRLLDTRPIRNLGASSYSLYLTHGPIVVVVYDKLVAGRVRQGVPAFVVSLALVVPLTIVFARVFASVFEAPFRRRRSRSARRRSVVQEPGRERVAQQYHVADPAHVGQRGAPPRVPREAPVAHEARGARVADEEGRHDELQLVDQVVGQELGVDDASALDHEPLHAAVGKVLAEPAHPHARATVHDRGHRPEPRLGIGHPRARGVDELLGLAGGEEVRARVEVAPVGHGDLHR
jgi:peptidoglycan/LPS O-acetylase OafA/YrhL